MTFKKQTRIEKQSVGFSEDDIRNLMESAMGVTGGNLRCVDCSSEREVWELKTDSEWYGIQAKAANGLVFVTVVPQHGDEMTTLILNLETDEFIEI